MVKQSIVSILMVLAMILLVSGACHAAMIRATSCSQSHVQSAIDSAKTGDQVAVPAGSCTWSTTMAIPSYKKITLQGAGIDSTVISMSPAGEAAVDASQSGARITGFTFNAGYIIVDGDGWRVDHNKFLNEGIFVRGTRETQHPTGLIDHCTFLNGRIVVYGWNGLLAHALWAQTLNLGGGAGVVYVEDCSFTATIFTNAMDTNYGGRYVFRYNTLTDTYVEAHSIQGNHRASRRWEIYNNTFNQVNTPMWVPMMLRGGTGVVFNNTLTGTWTQPNISLDNIRSCDSRDVSGLCDGSSPWDGNQAGGNGYPCRDQIGRSTDAYLWTGSNYPPQASEPAYAWNNKHGTNDVTFFQHSCAASAAHIQPGRDYIAGLQKPGYVPYTYPHPLAQGGSPIAIAPPQNLHIME